MALLRSIFRSWRTDVGPAQAVPVATDNASITPVAPETRSWAPEPALCPSAEKAGPAVVQQVESLPDGRRRVTWVATITTPSGGVLELHPQAVVVPADHDWPAETAARPDLLN